MSSVLDFPAAASMPAVVADLVEALDRTVCDVESGALGSLAPADLLAVTVQLQQVASRAQALVVTAAAEVRSGEVAKHAGFATTTTWLEVNAGMSKGQSRALLGLGERLVEEFPATHAAWLAGEIGDGAAREITSSIPRRLKGLPIETYADKRGELEALALHLAQTRTVSDVRRAIERAAIAADPAGADAAVAAAKESEFLSFTPVPDGVEVHGFLATETAALVLTAFDRCHDQMFRTGQLREDVTDDGRSLLPTQGLRRSRREHRNAQILTDLVTRLLDDGDLGTKHAQRPHLTVTVNTEDYAAGLGGEILLPGFGWAPVPNSTIDRIRCDAEIHPVLTTRTRGSEVQPSHGSDRAPLPGSVPRSTDPPWRPPRVPLPNGWRDEFHEPPTPPTQEQLAADTDLAAVHELGHDLDNLESWLNRFAGEAPRHVLDVGRSYRTAPPKLRRALTVRDRGCAAPGCDADPSRCEAHHIIYWEHHGETAISNMVLLCAKHHHLVHQHRLSITTNDDLEPGHPDYIRITVVPTPTSVAALA